MAPLHASPGKAVSKERSDAKARLRLQQIVPNPMARANSAAQLASRSRLTSSGHADVEAVCVIYPKSCYYLVVSDLPRSKQSTCNATMC